MTSRKTETAQKRLLHQNDQNSIKSQPQVTKIEPDDLSMYVTKSPKEISSLTERIESNFKSREEHPENELEHKTCPISEMVKLELIPFGGKVPLTSLLESVQEKRDQTD